VKGSRWANEHSRKREPLSRATVLRSKEGRAKWGGGISGKQSSGRAKEKVPQDFITNSLDREHGIEVTKTKKGKRGKREIAKTWRGSTYSGKRGENRRKKDCKAAISLRRITDSHSRGGPGAMEEREKTKMHIKTRKRE